MLMLMTCELTGINYQYIIISEKTQLELKERKSSQLLNVSPSLLGDESCNYGRIWGSCSAHQAKKRQVLLVLFHSPSHLSLLVCPEKSQNVDNVNIPRS